jgi:hypothetical protein
MAVLAQPENWDDGGDGTEGVTSPPPRGLVRNVMAATPDQVVPTFTA